MALAHQPAVEAAEHPRAGGCCWWGARSRAGPRRRPADRRSLRAFESRRHDRRASPPSRQQVAAVGGLGVLRQAILQPHRLDELGDQAVGPPRPRHRAVAAIDGPGRPRERRVPWRPSMVSMPSVRRWRRRRRRPARSHPPSSPRRRSLSAGTLADEHAQQPPRRSRRPPIGSPARLAVDRRGASRPRSRSSSMLSPLRA